MSSIDRSFVSAAVLYAIMKNGNYTIGMDRVRCNGSEIVRCAVIDAQLRAVPGQGLGILPSLQSDTHFRYCICSRMSRPPPIE